MNTPTALIIAEDDRPRGRHQLRSRRVSVHDAAATALARAVETGRPAVRCEHGGGVANRYGYPASTEGVVVVAYPDGRAVAWLTVVPANKVTLSGVAAAAMGETARALFDGRFGRAAKADALAIVLEQATAALAGEAVAA